eukprot:284818790_3
MRMGLIFHLKQTSTSQFYSLKRSSGVLISHGVEGVCLGGQSTWATLYSHFVTEYGSRFSAGAGRTLGLVSSGRCRGRRRKRRPSQLRRRGLGCLRRLKQSQKKKHRKKQQLSRQKRRLQSQSSRRRQVIPPCTRLITSRGTGDETSLAQYTRSCKPK